MRVFVNIRHTPALWVFLRSVQENGLIFTIIIITVIIITIINKKRKHAD